MNVRGILLALWCSILVITSTSNAQHNYLCSQSTFNFSSITSTLRVRGSRNLHLPKTFCLGTGTLDINDDSIVKPGLVCSNGGRLILNGNFSDSIVFACLNQTTASPIPEVDLSGDDIFRPNIAVFPLPIRARNFGNRLEGSALFEIASDTESTPGILLIGPDTDLTVALQSTLNSFIGMECATLYLDSDLQFEAGKSIVGMGTVDLNGHLLSFGGGDLGTSHAIRWINASGIILNADTLIGSMWLFGPSIFPARIDGNGAFLDISGTGALIVEPGVELTLQNLVLKDFGPAAIGLVDSTAVVRLCNTTIILTQDTTYEEGTFLVNSPNVKFITGNHTITFCGNAKLIVDGVTLEVDTLSFMNGSSINFCDRSINLELRNGGRICSPNCNLRQDGDNYILDGNYDFSDSDCIEIDVRHMTLEGNGRTIDFSQEKARGIHIKNQGKITTTNVTLRSFRPDHLMIEDKGSCLFGDNTTIELGKLPCRSASKPTNTSQAIDLDYTWTFGGKEMSVLDLAGGTLCLKKTGQLRVTGSGGLLIKNGSITGLRRQNIHLEQPDATLTLEGVALELDQNVNFSSGTLSISSDVSIYGAGRVFCFSSNGNVVLQPASVLTFDQGTVFRYAPVNNDRHRFCFVDKTGTLSLREATIHNVCKNGMLLNTGNIAFDGTITLRNDYELDQAALRIDCFLKQYRSLHTSIKTSGKVILQKDIARIVRST